MLVACMTNAEASAHLGDLRRLIERDVILPAIAWHRIIQNARALEMALQPMEKSTEEIIDRYSCGGTVIEIDKEKEPEKFDKCYTEISAIQGARIEVQIKKISIRQIEDCKLPASAFFALEFMLEDE